MEGRAGGPKGFSRRWTVTDLARKPVGEAPVRDHADKKRQVRPRARARVVLRTDHVHNARKTEASALGRSWADRRAGAIFVRFQSDVVLRGWAD